MKDWTSDHPTLVSLIQMVAFLDPNARKHVTLIVGAGWAEYAAKTSKDLGIKCLIGMMDDPWSACLCMNCTASPA